MVDEPDTLCVYRCARHVQYALGNVYSIQVIESIVLIVFCLIKLVVRSLLIVF